MSLLHEIENKHSYVRRFMDAWLPDLPVAAQAIGQRLRSRPLVHPASYEDKHLYMVVGTAADYRLRAFFDPAMHRSLMVQNGLAYGPRLSWLGFRNPWKPRKGFNLAETFVDAYEQFIAGIGGRGLPHDPAGEGRLVRFCFWFAHLDALGRVPLEAWSRPPGFLFTAAGPDVDAMLAAVPDAMAEDVCRLATSFRARHSRAIGSTRTVFLGQEALAQAHIVGQADFDLVADGTLYEFKTTLRPQGIPKILRQVAGYWLLDRDDVFGIRTAAIEFPRQEHAEAFDIAAGLLGTDDADMVRKLFHEGAATGIVPQIPAGLKRERPLLVPARAKPIWEVPIVMELPPGPKPAHKPRSWVEPDGSIMVEPDPDDPPVRRGRKPLYGRAMTSAERNQHARLRKTQNSSS